MGWGLLKSSNIRISFSGRGRGGVVSVLDGATGNLEALARRRPKRRLEVSSSGIISFSSSSWSSSFPSRSRSSGDGVLGMQSSMYVIR